MNYAQLIHDTLLPLGIPMKETMYTGTAPAYIVFDCYLEQGAAFAENRAVEREYNFTINIFQKIGDTSIDLNAVKEQAISLLESAGFENVIARNRSDLETQYNRWLIDCSYTENLQ